MTSGTVSINP